MCVHGFLKNLFPNKVWYKSFPYPSHEKLEYFEKKFAWVTPYFPILKKYIEICFSTDQFCGLIWPLVDKRFKGFLHQVDELFIPLKAHFYHVVHSVLKIQQVLHHIFIFFRIDNNCCPKSLQGQTHSHQQVYDTTHYFLLLSNNRESLNVSQIQSAF